MGSAIGSCPGLGDHLKGTKRLTSNSENKVKSTTTTTTLAGCWHLDQHLHCFFRSFLSTTLFFAALTPWFVQHPRSAASCASLIGLPRGGLELPINKRNQVPRKKQKDFKVVDSQLGVTCSHFGCGDLWFREKRKRGAQEKRSPKCSPLEPTGAHVDVQCHLFMKYSQILQGNFSVQLGNAGTSRNIQEPRTKTTMTITVFQTPSWQRGPARGSYGNASKEDSDWQKWCKGVEKQSISISILVTSLLCI